MANCAGARSPGWLGSFRCDTELHVTEANGTIAERLNCDLQELLGHGWQPFVHQDDGSVIGRMLANAAQGRPSRYDLRATTRSRERLYLEVRTMAVHGGDEISTAGSVELLAWESPRVYVLL